MAIDKLIPQYLNLDDDERIVQSFEMVDALNIRVSHEEDGDAGVVKNVEGNQSIPAKSSKDAIPSSGLNKVIGAVSSEAHRAVYFFLYNGAGYHGIYKYHSSPEAEGGDSYQKVYESSDLNFGLQTYISADLIVNQNGEHLLYFTDDRNEPRKINATKALSGVYPDEFTSGTGYEKELFLTVCKQPPLEPPTFEFKSNSSIKRNQLSSKIFQFAYQYVYDDGEISALSPYSKIAVSPTHVAYNSAQRDFYEELNNEIDITLKCTVGPVEKIRLFAREGQSGFFHRIDEVDNERLQDSVVVKFRNDGLYVPLDKDTSNKQFDSVPRLAAAQTFSNSRLFYGNYLEGFDNIKTDSIQYPVYDIPIEPATMDAEERTRFNSSYGDFYNTPESVEFFKTALATGGPLDLLAEMDTNGGADINGFLEVFAPKNDFEDVQMSFSGKPIGFKIDTSSIPSSGLTVASKIFLNYYIVGDSIGFAQTTEYDTTGASYNYERNSFNVDISLFRDGQAVSTAPSQISVLNPAKYSRTTFFNSNNYQSPQPNRHRWGSLGGMDIKGSFEISESIDVPANTSKDGIITLILERLNNLAPFPVAVGSKMTPLGTLQAQVSQAFSNNPNQSIPRAQNIAALYHSLNVNDSNLSQSTLIPNNCYQSVGNSGREHMHWIYIEWDGSFTFKTDAFYSGSEDAVLVRFQTDRIDLEAVGAVASSAFSFLGDGTGAGPISKLNAPGTSDWCPSDMEPGQGFVYPEGTIQCGIHTGEITSNIGGLPLKDVQGSGGVEFATAISGMRVEGLGQIVPSEDDVEKSKSFKSGATHEFGVVYFDDRNRSSGVQKLGSVRTSHIGHYSRNGRHGSTSIDLRILHEPPLWANRWAPVYSSNNTYETFLQFTVAEALLPNLSLFRDILSPAGVDEEEDTLKNSRIVNTSLGDDIRSAIFLSMRPLEGKNNSYKEFKGGEISYEYKDGDILRVISYYNPQGSIVYPQNREFKITGYHYYIDDESNPLQVQVNSVGDEGDGESAEKDNTYRRTGWFLSIRDNDYANFTRADVQLAKDFFSQRCIVEIIRPKKQQEEPVFYEIGESYPIVTVNGSRTHGGDRSNSSVSGVSCTILNQYYFESFERFYIGDKVIFDDTQAIASPNSSGYAFVAGVIPTENAYKYYIHSSGSFSTAVFGVEYDNCSLDNTPGNANGCFPGVVNLRDGDVYLKQREMLVNPELSYSPLGGATARKFHPGVPRQQDYKTFTIEDPRASDFFDSKVTSFGRAHIETPDQQKIRRFSSITYSDPLAFDSSVLGLSSFNASKFPYYDMPSQHGGVTAIVDGNESLTVLQESKVSLVPINRNIVKMGENSNLITSNNVVGTPTFLAGSYGPGRSPEGVVNRFGIIYFSDPNSGVVCSVSSKGIIPISSAKMESYFETLFGGLSGAVARPRIPSGFDPENTEYIISSEAINFVKIVVDSSTVGYAQAAPASADQDDVFVYPVFSDSLILKWDTDPMDWDENAWTGSCIPKWENTHQGIIFFDRINQGNGCYIAQDLEDNNTERNLRIDTVDEGFTYRGSAIISLVDHSVTFCDSVAETDEDGGTQALTVTSITNPDNSTVAWSPTAEKWLTFYSFIPEMYANIQNKFFSFKDGQMWYHNKAATRNSFYGTTYDSSIELISKANPSSVKEYRAMSLEGNSSWKATLSNSSQQSSAILSTYFKEKEGMYYANVPRVIDEDITGGGAVQFGSTSFSVIGVVASIDTVANTITFESNVNKSPVSTGEQGYLYRATPNSSLWTYAGSTKIQSVIGPKTVSCSGTVAAFSVGDIVANAYGSGIGGDPLRGYYAKVKLESSDTTAKELYAVNLVYEPSSLHNVGGQPNNQ